MTFVLIDGNSRTEFEDGVRAVMAYTDTVTHGRPCTLLDEGLPGTPSVEIATYEGTPSLTPGTDLCAEPSVAHDHVQALWYAKGFIACTGALSPFDSQSDPQDFAGWYLVQSDYPNIGQAWGVWCEQRRAETGL